jgi:hypothetical protein
MLKKAIDQAINDGKSWVAWTTGAQQADFYDLSKQISKINYIGDKTLRAFDLSGNQVLNKDYVKPEDLEQYIGKDAAKKLMEVEPHASGTGKGVRTLEGVDLKTSPNWTASMYGDENGNDKSGKPSLIKQAAMDIARKMGGEVGSVELPLSAKKYTVGNNSYADADENNQEWIIVDNEHNIISEHRTESAANKHLAELNANTVNQKQPALIITPTMRQKILDEGMPLFSKKELNKLAKAWQELAKDDKLFAYRKSDSKDMLQVFNDVAGNIDIEVKPTKISDIDTAWVITPKGSYSNNKGHVILYKDGSVEVSLKNLKSGSLGSSIYSAVGNWAYNNGKVFTEDRWGISKTGMERRLENLISLALKFESTDFIRLSEKTQKQLGIDWIEGDTLHNLNQLLNKSLELTRNAITDKQWFDGIRFNFSNGRFEHESGKDVGGDEYIRQSELARTAGGNIGKSTIKRALLSQSIRQGGNDVWRGQVFGGTAKQSTEGIPGGLEGIAYSKRDVEDKGDNSKLALEALFKDLSPRANLETRQAALARIDSFDNADKIRYVEDNFYDILGSLEESGKVVIKC